MTEKKIGIISDTHGLIRPEALESLKGCDLILHAGDIGSMDIIESLMEIAPTIAVRGNCDRGELAEKFHATEAVEVNGFYFYMLHNIGDLDIAPKEAGFKFVISGHSHSPSYEFKKGVIYINPGSAGKRRFDLPVSLAKIHIKDGEFEVSFITLKV